MYNDNPVDVVDMLYEMIFDDNLLDHWERESIISVLFYLFLMHKKNGNDVEYIQTQYRKTINTVLSDKKYNKNRSGIDFFLNVGFTIQERQALLKKYLKTETDPETIQHYKYGMLFYDMQLKFPKQKGFSYMTSILELNSPKENTVNEIQKLVNDKVSTFGKDIVQEYLKTFLYHEYAKESSKTVLRQIKIGDDSWIK